MSDGQTSYTKPSNKDPISVPSTRCKEYPCKGLGLGLIRCVANLRRSDPQLQTVAPSADDSSSCRKIAVRELKLSYHSMAVSVNWVLFVGVLG